MKITTSLWINSSQRKPQTTAIPPPLVYDAVLRWARKCLDIEDRPVVRPFFPGGDYEHYDYPDNCVVIDNPPFSIFAKIVDFYVERKIPFLLFAPAMTSIRHNCCYIGIIADIIYENGANVGTSFVTNMIDAICITSPSLHEEVKKAVQETQKEKKKQLRKLSFPDNVLRATELQTMSRAGVNFRLSREEGRVIRKACNGKEFGNSILLSDKATAEKLAAEKLAAEKMAAEKMGLSEESKRIIAELNHEDRNIVASTDWPSSLIPTGHHR